MEVSLLNMRITIEKSSVATDEIGNYKTEWADYFRCFATISNEGGEETEDAGATHNRASCAFTVRWSSETARITSTGYRIRVEDDLYNILRVDHMNNKRKALKFWCRKVDR